MSLLPRVRRLFGLIHDCIVFCPSDQSIYQVVTDLHAWSRQFTVDDQGDVGDFLGIQVQKQDNGLILLMQPQLIDSIIKDLHLQTSSNSKKTPSVTTSLLHKDADGPPMTPDFHYRSVIGKLNFLEKSTHPDISITMHQCVRFSENPKRSHAEAVKRIGRYLLSSRDKGLIIRPSQVLQFDYWVDADFTGNWQKFDVHIDSMTSKSHSGWLKCVENLNQVRTDRRTVELRFSWEWVLNHTWISPWTQKGILLCEMDPRKRSVTYVFMDDETSV